MPPHDPRRTGSSFLLFAAIILALDHFSSSEFRAAKGAPCCAAWACFSSPSWSLSPRRRLGARRRELSNL